MFDLEKFGQLGQMQQKMEEIKQKLDSIEITGEAGNGEIKVTANANKKITDISISEKLLAASEKEQLQDLLVVAVNRAMENADVASQKEMLSASAGMIPNLGDWLK
jgi:DNA-binding YbaB/EbfC family protein